MCVFQYKDHLPGMRVPIIKICRPKAALYYKGNSYTGRRRYLYIETTLEILGQRVVHRVKAPVELDIKQYKTHICQMSLGERLGPFTKLCNIGSRESGIGKSYVSLQSVLFGSHVDWNNTHNMYFIIPGTQFVFDIHCTVIDCKWYIYRHHLKNFIKSVMIIFHDPNSSHSQRHKKINGTPHRAFRFSYGYFVTDVSPVCPLRRGYFVTNQYSSWHAHWSYMPTSL